MKLSHFATIAALALLACSHPAAAQTANKVTFTLSTTTGTDKKSVVPTLTWSTTPAAPSCTASGAADWTGAKASSGSVTLAAVTASVVYSIVCDWPGVTKAVLAWTPPTTNTDGSQLTDLAGYRIQYGNKTANEADLDGSVYLQNPIATGWTSPDLAAGTWFFGVKAFNSLGLESALSNVASKTLTGAASDNRSLTLGIKFPKAPVLQ